MRALYYRTDLFAADICPAQQCVDLTGGKTVSTFAAGTAGMGIIGNFKVDAVDGAELGGGAAWGWTLVRPFASTRGVGHAGGLRTTTAWCHVHAR